MKKGKSNPNRITLTLTERELEILDFIQKREGQARQTDIVHQCLKVYYNKLYYTKHKDPFVVSKSFIKEEALTPEQYCEAGAGTVTKKNGDMVCEVKRGRAGTVVQTWPLSEVDAQWLDDELHNRDH